MSQLTPLIADLALILMCAGIMTLLFKRLKQPLVLGYIVAGFIASPHMPYMPSVADEANIKIWADIGVIFLLFSLGMEFSLKKMMKNGSTAIVAALSIMVCMMLIGFFTGLSFGWTKMDCIYLAGMMAMSSTTIIYKAFDDLGLRQQPFAVLVISVLVVEDILAVVMMVLLSTVAVSQNFEGMQLVYSILKLVFYLILWFVVGIFVIPLVLKKFRHWLGDETMLILSLALCFAMVVLASKAGFSAAFGAFIMGSILAETVEVEHIEHLVSPVKDLFGAIFFVSVGMMVDVNMIIQYWCPILVISLAIIVGQCLFGSASFILAGQPLKTAMRCGFSLTQIGEFAFIIATLGMSMGVIGNYLYPIVVLVSVITTFISPYMIRLSVPASNWVEKSCPRSWLKFIDNYTAGHTTSTMDESQRWHHLLLSYLKSVAIYSVLCIGVLLLSFNLLVPILIDFLPEWGCDFLSVSIITTLLFPLLYALVIKQKHPSQAKEFFQKNRYYRGVLIFISILRILLAMLFLMIAVNHFYHLVTAIVVTLLLTIGFIFSINHSKRIFWRLENTFMENFNSRELHEEQKGKKNPKYAAGLLSRDIHFMEYEIPQESSWGGQTLKELNLAQRYGVHVASLLRGSYRINIPGGGIHLFPGDRLQVIGSDEQLKCFGDDLQTQLIELDETNMLEREMIIQQFIIKENSPFIDKSIAESGLRDTFGCLAVGLERNGIQLPVSARKVLQANDILWLVGEKKNLKRLNAQN